MVPVRLLMGVASASTKYVCTLVFVGGKRRIKGKTSGLS